MGWRNSWDKPNVEIIPPSEPENQFWSGGALIFENMTKEEFKKKYPNRKYGKLNTEPTEYIEEASAITEEAWNKLKPLVGIDLGAGDSQTVLTTFEDGKIRHRVIPPHELYKNLKPTHDPYTNPNAHLYYECACGAILDPQTKSFAALNNYASDKGWKIRFGHDSYVPYCVKCGEGID